MWPDWSATRASQARTAGNDDRSNRLMFFPRLADRIRSPAHRLSVKAREMSEGRYVRSSDRVIEYMKNGVPEGTIAIIDDSGGTLTAPILEHFAGIVCAGGTVRSHLGILAREYGIPCLMNAKIRGIHDGDRLEIETSAEAMTAEAYFGGQAKLARVWKVVR